MDIITGKILKLNNWPDGKIIGLAKQVAAELAETGLDRELILARLEAVRLNPGPYLAEPLLADLARECLRLASKAETEPTELRELPLPYPIWGREAIDDGSLAQMDNAMRLPISVAGALMPDAHIGYGLPIGGVLATENAVIPYAVGVDIACRMRLSLYEVSPYLLGQKPGLFENALWEQTAFGTLDNGSHAGSLRSSANSLSSERISPPSISQRRRTSGSVRTAPSSSGSVRSPSKKSTRRSSLKSPMRIGNASRPALRPAPLRRSRQATRRRRRRTAPSERARRLARGP